VGAARRRGVIFDFGNGTLDHFDWATVERATKQGNVLDAIAKAGAGFRSLKDAWADTTTPHGRLMLTVLGGLAEFERELIRARTGEGRKRAQARGVRFGRAAGETQADVARTGVLRGIETRIADNV
jgi:DNA invertase Pin-like site-specific DNA recombinase